MDSLQRQQAKRYAAVGLAAVAIVVMIAINARDPHKTIDDQVREVTASLTNADWGNLTPEQRDAMREQWEALSPEARSQVFKSLAHTRLEEMRERTAGTSPEERAKRIREATAKLRAEHEGLPPAERSRIRERLNSDEGRQMIRAGMEIYANEFTARERAELDPLVHEWLYQIEKLSTGR